MPLLTVRHVSTYRYKQPVGFGEHRVMFRPRDSYDQRLLHASLHIDPEPASLRWMHDVFGNCVACATFTGRATMLRFESVIQLEHASQNMLDFTLAAHAEHYPFTYDPEDMPDLLRSMERHTPDPNRVLAAWAGGFVQAHPSGARLRTADLLARITRTIHAEFTYVRREERGIQDPLLTLKLRSGSCRDFALLMMEAVRALGFAARFVSGYLYSPAEDTPGAGATRTGGGSTHAWVQVYLPGAGWMEFDPTNGIVGNHDLIRVAIARDPAQAVPLWGSWIGFPSDSLGLTVEVSVTSSADPHQAPHPSVMAAGPPAPAQPSPADRRPKAARVIPDAAPMFATKG